MRDPHQLPHRLSVELATYIRDEVQREVRAARAGEDPDPEVPHVRWPCASRRAACDLAKSGALAGVRRVGRGPGTVYLVRRSILDAWIEAENRRDVMTASDADDPFEAEMRKRGLVAPAQQQQPRRKGQGG